MHFIHFITSYLVNRNVRYKRKLALMTTIRNVECYQQATRNRRKRAKRQITRLMNKQLKLRNIIDAICAEEDDETESQDITNHESAPMECNDMINSLNENNNTTAQPTSNRILVGDHCQQEAMHEDVVHFDVQDSTGFQDIQIAELHEELKLCGSNKVSINRGCKNSLLSDFLQLLIIFHFF